MHTMELERTVEKCPCAIENFPPFSTLRAIEDEYLLQGRSLGLPKRSKISEDPETHKFERTETKKRQRRDRCTGSKYEPALVLCHVYSMLPKMRPQKQKKKRVQDES